MNGGVEHEPDFDEFQPDDLENKRREGDLVHWNGGSLRLDPVDCLGLHVSMRVLGLGLGLGLGLVLIRILLSNLSSRLCLYAGCTLVSKSAGFSIPSTYLIILSSLTCQSDGHNGT